MAAKIIERVFDQWLWRLPSGGKSVALTFDDGPSPETTPALVSALNRLHIPATHFLVGERCAKSGALVRELSDAGQTIGIHGFTHQSMLFRSTLWQRDSIARSIDQIIELGLQPPVFFRPPYGHFNPSTSRVVRSAGCRGVLWSIICQDWRGRSVQELCACLNLQLHDGAIIVLHDAHATTNAVIKALAPLKDEVLRRGWSFVSLTNPKSEIA